MGLILIAAAGLPALPEPTSFPSIGWLVVCAAALIAAINQVDDFIARRKDKPPSAEVQKEAAELYVRKEDCTQRRKELEQKIATIEAQVSSDRRDAIEGRRNLHNKVEAAGLAMATSVDTMRRELTDRIEAVRLELAAKSEDMPARIIAILSNTHVIK